MCYKVCKIPEMMGHSACLPSLPPLSLHGAGRLEILGTRLGKESHGMSRARKSMNPENQFTVRKKMAAIHFTTIHCEPN